MKDILANNSKILRFAPLTLGLDAKKILKFHHGKTRKFPERNGEVTLWGFDCRIIILKCG